MSENTRGTVLGIIIVVLLIALIAFARGPDHHRGDEIGALRATTTTAHR